MRKRLWLTAGLAVASMVVTAVPANAAPAGTSAQSATRPTQLTRAQTATVRAQLRAGTLAKTRGQSLPCGGKGLACDAIVVTKSKSSKSPLVSEYGQIGYAASDLQKAYRLGSAQAGHGTVALIETGTYPNLESDLGIYRSFNGLRPCTSSSGCLKIVNKTGGKKLEATPTDFNLLFGEEELAVETALDVDMVSAACPACHIVVVDLPLLDGFFPDSTAQANAQFRDFATGVHTAVGLGAKGISISYGLPATSYSDKGAPAASFRQPGVAIVASSGDDAAEGDSPVWPQNLTTVISAGGTSLFTSSTSKTGFAETAWAGAGSSCSRDLPKAVGQPKGVASACDGTRASTDLSAVADPDTGVSVYDSYAPATGFPLGFFAVGGTSVASPFIAALNVRAGVAAGAIGPNELYSAPKSTITDVTIGSNAQPGACPEFDLRNCNSDVGWDGPTGLGSPKGLAPFDH